jgi:hypothetical protein
LQTDDALCNPALGVLIAVIGKPVLENVGLADRQRA